MKPISSAGVVFLYLTGKIANNKEIQIQQINTYKNAFDFYDKAKELKKNAANSSDIELFCVLGLTEKTEKIEAIINKQIKNNFNQILKNYDVEINCKGLDALGNNFNKLVQEHIFLKNKIKYPREHSIKKDSWKMYCIWAGDGPEDEAHWLMDSLTKTWLEYEKPLLLGKQIMIQTFQLEDLNGRKIIGIFPNQENGEWLLVLDGGLKLKLNSEVPYLRERIGVKDIEQFTLGELDTILNNPIYAHGKGFYPMEIYEEWHKIFLYVVALQNWKWNEKNIASLYEEFLRFMKENICDVIPAKSIIEKGQFYEALLINILEIQKFLRGEDGAVISKDFWLFLNSRYIYLPYIYDLLHIFFSKGVTEEFTFNQDEFKKIIQDSEIKDTYQKGLYWEKTTEYFLNCIAGLKISGRRVKTLAQEIDLSVVNTSLDHNLWEMGAYILVECKNWKEKVGIQVIRGLAHISELKGNKTTFLFVANGLTRDAEKEILRSALNGKFILNITRKDLYDLKNEKECHELLIKKWREVQEKVELELSL